jgi:DNA-binding transcriptional ArsR family regulator
MRPLVHPSLDDITVEGILHALSDPVRASIYARLAGLDCAATCTAFQQVSDRTIPKSSLSQHFRVLREAGLVRSERAGVEMHNTTRCAEIEQRFPGLIPAILKAHQVQAGVAASLRKPASRRKTGAA